MEGIYLKIAKSKKITVLDESIQFNHLISYLRLKDENDEVRYCALITIIDLIRQEMIKVRSQIAGIAKLLVDENLKIKCKLLI